jgi:hypothetical protein
MTKTETQTVTLKDDLTVDLTFHNFSANLLKEFALHIVKPYFNGNTTQAVQTLMEKALTEENLFNQTIKQ